MGSGIDGRCTSIAFNRWNDDERNVNVNRNGDEWLDYWWFAGVRKLLFCYWLSGMA